MSTITTIASSDTITSSRTVINTNFSNLNTDKMETSVLDTDNTLAANSDAKVASQKAVKTYIDTSGGTNASTTARGIVEEATQAEVDAGTAAGGTAARLFINPSTTVATNAQRGFTYKQKVTINPAESTVASSNAETTLFSVSIPANTLSTSNGIRFKAYFSDFDLASSHEVNLRLKYGSTTLCLINSQAPSTFTNWQGVVEGIVVADGATNAQKGFLEALFTVTGIETTGQANVGPGKFIATKYGSSAEDSTGALNLVLSNQWGTSEAASSMTVEFWVVELIA